MPSSVQLQQLRYQLNAEGDKNPEVQLAERCFRRYQKALHLTVIFADISQWQYAYYWPEQHALRDVHSINLPDHLGELVFSTAARSSAPIASS